MTEKNIYIDKLVKENIKDYSVNPNVKWLDFNEKFNKYQQQNGIRKNQNGFRKYFSFKKIFFAVLLLSVISFVLFISTKNKDQNQNILIRSKSRTEISPDIVKPVQPIEEKAAINETDSKDLEKEENIIIKKQVIIRDTVYL